MILDNLKENLNAIGLKLILDFIPNHLSCDSILVKYNPEYFLQADEEIYNNDIHTYFKSEYHPEKYFAHGRDPLFPAWSDTIQINHFSTDAREYLTNTLIKLTEVCDGVRCDMAMLQLNNVFQNTWMGVINKFNIQKPSEEFWSYSIKKVKSKFEDFIFIAEAYWDLEWELQQLGFDYTYDKRLLDRLSSHDLIGVKNHLNADLTFQQKSVRFIENHDEKRAASKFGRQASLAAALLISTIPGMKLYFDGQFEGRKIKLPVQIGKEPVEKESKTVKDFYNKILKITKNKIFSEGNFLQLNVIQASPNNFSSENIFAWLWKLKSEYRLIVINFSEVASQCRIKIDLNTSLNEIILEDELKNMSYRRSAVEIRNPGLYVDLKSYCSHVFAFKLY